MAQVLKVFMANVVLLVEDDPNDVFLMRRAIDKAGSPINLQVIDDGEKAIDYLSGTPPYGDRRHYPIPDLLLLDLKIPRRSGMEILEWVRSSPHLSRMTVIMFSSSRELIDIHRAYDLGANSYLVKPVSFGDLIGTVELLDSYWLKLNARPDIFQE